MTASRSSVSLFVAGALLAGALVQAQQAPRNSQVPTTPASIAMASPPGQKADGHVAAAAAVQADAAKKAADQLVKDARYAGFKPERIRGTLMFCRTTTELGSNFPVRTCYNEDQVRIKIQEYQTQRNQLRAEHNLGLQVH